MVHKAFKDHLTAWIMSLVGHEDLDCIYMRQPKLIGFRHFNYGISKISQ